MVKGIKVISLVLFSLFTLFLYIFISFVFGGHELIKGAMGNDAWSYITRLKMLSDSFPTYPFWNFKEAAGSALAHVYPILTHTLLILTSKVLGLTLLESFKLWGFLSIPIFAWGIFNYALVRFKIPVVAFLAGIFYLISPISSIWIFEWGFYAETIASVFFPFTILFFDLFLSDKKRIYFILSTLLLSLTFLAHPTVFFGTLSLMIPYSVIYPIISKKDIFANIYKNLLSTAAVSLAALLLASFWILPFYQNSKLVGQGDTSGRLTKQNYGIDLDLLKVLTFKIPFDMDAATYFQTHSELAPGDSTVNGRVWEKGYIFKNFSFPKGISLLFIAGIILSLVVFETRRASLAVVAVLTLLAAVSDDLIIFLANTPFVSYFASWRSLIFPDRVLIPIFAALGCYLVFELLVMPFKLKPGIFNFGLKIIFSVLAVIIAGGVLYQFRIYNNLKNPNYLSAYARNVNLGNIWKQTGNPDDICLLTSNFENENCKKLYPQTLNSLKSDLTLSKAVSQLSGFKENDFSVDSGMKELFSIIPRDSFIRYDYSPLQTALSMRAPYFVETPQYNSYVHTAYLNRRLVGFEISNFYANDPVYPDPLALPEIAKWYGNSLFVINPAKETEKFEKAGFIKVLDHLYKQEGNYIIDIFNKPKILVIGSKAKFAYDTIFKFTPFGFIDYNEAVLIKGEEKVDSYNEEQLSQYDGLILYGYKYGSKSKAHNLLDNYVKNGGRVFIETGWQYESADYQLAEDSVPGFLPVTGLMWGDVGKTSDFSVNTEITGEIDTSGFPPLIWNDLPWGISKPSGLKPWARPVLTANNTPLIALGQYGQGRVAWSGMNVFGHIKYFDHTNQELTVLGKVIDYLLEGESNQNALMGSDFSPKRIGNDKVEIVFNRSLNGYGLYFKEAFHPWWKARLIGSGKVTNLDILYAGPGYKFVNLPVISPGDKVELYVSKNFIYFSGLISLLTLIVLIVLMLRPELIKEIKIPKLPAIKINKGKEVNEDVDY